MPEQIPTPVLSGATDSPDAPQVSGEENKPWLRYKKPAAPAAPKGQPWKRFAKPTAQAQPVPAPTAPTKPDTSIAGRVEPYRAAVRQGVTQGIQDIVTYPFQAAQMRPGEGEGRRDIGPTGRFLLHSGEDVLNAGIDAYTARTRAAQSGEGFPGQAMSVLENFPFLRELTKAYEKSGGAFTPDVLQSMTRTGTQLVGPKAAADTLGVTVDKIRDASPAVLRKYAEKLNTRVLRQADEDSKDYKTSAALQVANEGIIGRIRTLPDKIERVRVAKDVEVKQSVAAAEKAGVTIDVSKDIQPIVGNSMRVLNQRGQLTSNVVAQAEALLKQITHEVDPQASAAAGKVVYKPVDLTKLSPSKAMALIKGLEDPAQFGKSTPTEIQNLARQLRGALNDRVGQRLPDVQKLRAEESRLITARDAARTNYAQLLNGKYKMINGIIYSDIGYIPLWLALKESGLGFGAATGGIVLLKALMDNAPSRTTRAALAAKLANMLERNKAALQAPSGAQTPPTGGTPTSLPNAPTAPPSAPNAALTAPPAQLPPGGPAQLPAGGSPTPQVAGTAAGAALDTQLFQQAKAELPNGTVSQWAQRAQELKLQHIAQSGAQSTTSSAGAEPDVEAQARLMKLRASEVPPAQAPKPKGVESKLGTPEEQARVKKAMEGRGAAKADLESGVGAKHKAMMDRLDVLLGRQSKPKSAMDNAAIQREIAEIKRVLTGEAKGPELAKINKHIADRERLAGKRAEAASQQTSTGATAGGEAVSQGASPEDRMIKLDLGYKALAKFDGGPEMVKALQKLAKDMQRIDPNYDELEKLKEAILLLHQVEGQ